nr:hypothetical protein [Streptomyces sp. SID4946]
MPAARNRCSSGSTTPSWTPCARRPGSCWPTPTCTARRNSGRSAARHALVGAIAAGDPDAAVEATRGNLDRTLDELRAKGVGPR